MASGPPLPVLNGYNQQLLHAHPKFSQKYCHWLTRGLKVQSFRANQQRTNAPRSRQPPPLLQYIHRPKTTPVKSGNRHDYGGNKNDYANADFNVVGVQKEVNGHSNTSKNQHDSEISKRVKTE